MYRFSFEKLDVWHRSRELVKAIYKITDAFPAEERYGMTSQLRRATVSISSNLAEGCSRKTRKDQAHFTQIAFSSLMEVLNLLILCVDLRFMDQTKFESTRPIIEEISNKLNALRKSQLSVKQLDRSTIN